MYFSDFLVLVKWPKWVHKHFQEVAEEVLSWEKTFPTFLDFLTEKILQQWFWS